MLREVKKEVDVMVRLAYSIHLLYLNVHVSSKRLLKGHPNIVYLIDAASYSFPNGTHEVFILMEFCQGGGIIDMMNRRLRERLAETDILQIFVDVCEVRKVLLSLVL